MYWTLQAAVLIAQGGWLCQDAAVCSRGTVCLPDPRQIIPTDGLCSCQNIDTGDYSGCSLKGDSLE